MNKDVKYLFEVDALSFSYRLGKCLVPALKNISLKIKRGELITLCGPSGSGKSTLLSIMGLIEPLQKGEVTFNQKEFSKLSSKERNKIRRYHIGFIFQQFHLIPVLSVEENVAYFLKTQGLNKLVIEKRVRETLTAVGLWDHRKKRPNQLSGGQRQRVAIARALAKEPEVIVGDEPTANLDQKTGREIMEIFAQLVKEKGITVILATHDEMVKSYASQNFVILDGKLIGDK
ncbi:MAG: ABC transporter ATP-binding protein [Simkaniaceae bacterium]|nr:ABC transporter ATP-binding protein [Simkaniaceae bacterium]MCF7851724.1 ABC transporter ATP-binding protein [Simkaniaceae bacterium]